MNLLTRAIGRRILDRIDVAVGSGRPSASRTVGGDLMSRIAAAGILRLALRWPALSVIVIVSVVAARLMTRRQAGAVERPALRAP